jgi:uncharacterized protein YjbI with pentapeptide repeats
MEINFKRYIYQIGIFLYDALGLKYIWEKINPPADENGNRPARTIFLWLLGIYVSLFGIASSRYEQTLSRLENRVSFAISQSESKNWKLLSVEIPKLQHEKIPFPPAITNPLSVIYSFFPSFNEADPQTINALQTIIYSKKEHLAHFNLSNLILSNDIDLSSSDISGRSFKIFAIKERNFSKSVFEGAILDNARLENVNFYKSNFKGAVLSNTNMQNCNLAETNLSDAILQNADLRKANLMHANMNNAILEGTNLEKAIIVGTNLVEVHDLNSAKLHSALYNSTVVELKHIPKAEEVKDFCEQNGLDTTHEKFIIEHISTIFERATKFPPNFKASDYGMIDIYGIIKQKKLN